MHPVPNDSSNSPLDVLGAGLALNMGDSMIDGMVSPSGFSTLIKSGRMKGSLNNTFDQIEWRVNRTGFDRFTATPETATKGTGATLVFRREGVRWILHDILMPNDTKQQTLNTESKLDAKLQRTQLNFQPAGNEINLVIETCYRLDNCGASKLKSITLLEAKKTERLVEANLIAGEIQDPDSKSGIVWRDGYTMFVLCSTDRPRLAWKKPHEMAAVELDITNIPGAEADTSELYLGICHGRDSKNVRENPAKFGYQRANEEDAGWSEISKPRDLLY